MEKETSPFDNFYRLYRKIRFLYRRGTLFHAKRAFIPSPPPPALKKKYKSRRILRKIRFVLRKGSLFKVRRHQDIQKSKTIAISASTGNDRPSGIYVFYRKIRYLVNTGKLFRRKKVKRKKLKNKGKIYRKIRYLWYHGKLFRPQKSKTVKLRMRSLGFITQREYVKIIINSTGLFLLAYLFIYLLINFSSSLVASSYDIKTIVYYSKIAFLINNYKWKYDQIVLVFSIGPFLCLIVAVVSLILYANLVDHKWFINLLFLWIFCHGFVHFFGEFFLGLILYKGFGYSLAYLFRFTREYNKLFLILFSVSAMIITGLLSTRLFIFSGNTYFKEINNKNRNYFIKSQFIVPCILGTIILLILKIPKISEFELYINLCIFLILLPVLFRSQNMQDCLFDEDPRGIQIYWKILILCFSLLLIFRLIFSNGIRMG